jgi:hypothetical protein
VTTGSTGGRIFWWNLGTFAFTPLLIYLLDAKEIILSFIRIIALSKEEMKLVKKAFNITWRVLFVFNGVAAIEVFLRNEQPPSIFLWNIGGLIVWLSAFLMISWSPRLFTVHHDH